jgi:dihydrofolate reductase
VFGRRTYEQLLPTWNARGGPFKDALNSSPKYVASTTLQEPLPWPNSTLLRGDIVDALRALKAQSGGVLAIMGSGVLIGSLTAADLIDEYLLMIHPLVLGTGRRLFPRGRARVAAAHRQRDNRHGRGDRHLRANEGLNVIPSGSQHQDPQAFQITRFCAPFTGVQQIAITVHMGGTARSAQVQDQSHIVTGHGSLMRYGYFPAE